MSKAQYSIYRGRVLDLSRTLVIKSSASANAVNRVLGYLNRTVNNNDPASWKYYKHLAGEYHSTDVPMTVTSLDTLQAIAFTKENLQEHLATAREYAQGGDYYRALVDQYPDQETLIQGILNPVDKQKAIDAEDGTILYYDPALVESNEENLIPKLERWCQIYMRRWGVRGYELTDELYVASLLGTMYMLIPAVVMNIRLGNCHTHYAHSYHIREYLASHGKLDWAVDYLTKSQMLWLYRNIRYIERNAGKTSTFESLVDNILTARNLPLARWTMRHNLAEMPTEIEPRIEFSRDTLNFDMSTNGTDTRTIPEMLDAELDVAKGNVRVIDEEAPLIRTQMENSLSDELKTKVLESAVLDLTDSNYYTQTDMLFYHWIYLAVTRHYTAAVVLDNPKTGAPLNLTVWEAAIVFFYCLNKSMGQNLIEIPTVHTPMVRRMPTPTRASVASMIDKKHRDPKVLEAIFSKLTPVGNYISTEAFNREVRKMHGDLMRHRWLWTTRENGLERGMVEAAATSLYCTYPCDLGKNETTRNYVQWFADKGLDMPTFTELEAGLLAEQLLTYCTGANLTVTTSLRDVQRAMLRVMSQLSSYTVQYLQSINSQPIMVVDWPMPRIQNIDTSAGDQFPVDVAPVYVKDVHVRGMIQREAHLATGLQQVDVKGAGEVDIDATIDFTASGRNQYHFRLEVPQFSVREVFYTPSQLDDVRFPDTESYTPIDRLPLQDAFKSLDTEHYMLDEEDRQTLRDRWNARPQVEPETVVADELRYTEMLEWITIGDGFISPHLLPTSVVIDGLGRPVLIPAIAPVDGYGAIPLLPISAPVDGFGLNTLLPIRTYIEGLVPPPPQEDVVVIGDGLDYWQTITVVGDGLGYPSLTQQILAEGLSYEELIEHYYLDFNAYPQ